MWIMNMRCNTAIVVRVVTTLKISISMKEQLSRFNIITGAVYTVQYCPFPFQRYVNSVEKITGDHVGNRDLGDSKP